MNELPGMDLALYGKLNVSAAALAAAYSSNDRPPTNVRDAFSGDDWEQTSQARRCSARKATCTPVKIAAQSRRSTSRDFLSGTNVALHRGLHTFWGLHFNDTSQ